MLREILEEISTNEKMDDSTFVDAMVDLADKLGVDYLKKDTKDIIGDLVTDIRKNHKALYNYWSKNRSKELMAELEKAFN